MSSALSSSHIFYPRLDRDLYMTYMLQSILSSSTTHYYPLICDPNPKHPQQSSQKISELVQVVVELTVLFIKGEEEDEEKVNKSILLVNSNA